MGIDLADLFERWDFDRKALTGPAKGPSKGSFGALSLRGGDLPRLEGPSPSTGAKSSWPLYPGTTATVETAGSIQAIRGRNLAAKAVGGLLVPGGVFLFGNARVEQHDLRELYLIVSGPACTETWALHPDLAAGARRFAAQITFSVAQAASKALPTQPQPAEPSSEDVLDRLERLHALHVSGALSAEEFAAQKARLLET
jgi:hypothetical protein